MINVKNLCFSYTKQPFIENMSFSVKKGEIFGFLGPSGAGKTTLQRILIGLQKGYSGSVMLDNKEINSVTRDFYNRIGVDFEFPSLYERLTAMANLVFFASLYKKSLSIEQLLKDIGLYEDKDKLVSDYSKGMKSRLNFIKALLHDPDILFLDEPTSGLDPSNAKIMKDIILKEKEKGKTIILTTHNMYDAAELCDRVAFIFEGKIKALDTPRNLVMSKGATQIKYTFLDENKERSKTVNLNETSQDTELSRLIAENQLLSIHSSEPTLNDIFVSLTGRHLK